MILYLIKIMLCSALLILVYKGLLEKEKMHRFNRAYILGSLTFSILVPFFTFNHGTQHLPFAGSMVKETAFILDNGVPEQTIDATTNINYPPIIFLIIYLSIAVLLFLRFAVNLKILLQRAWRNPKIKYKNSEIVLIDQYETPHSFLNYIFVNADDYLKGNIQKEILLHEFTHVKQKHSWDIIFFEIIQVLFWFNPVLFIYRKALLLNHEFLADEAVIGVNNDVSAYQRLLLEIVCQQRSSFITSQFKYSITKQRLLMMTKTKSFRNALCRQIAVVPILGISLILFSTKINAQETKKVEESNKMEVQSTKDGITDEQLSEFDDIVSSIMNDKGRPAFYKLTEENRNKLESLYLLMSKEQQEKQLVVFRLAPEPLPKSTPTQDQIKSWKDPNMYGVWIDGKRISNTKLNDYSPADFDQLFVSKLEKNAVNYGKHYYQVNLMTNEYYESYYKKMKESCNKYFMGYRMPQNQ
ncbi:M56 family metallopeptidase [Cyclobacterium sp.]|uniref:M56 family metallopeptidase n=1 Tax=Cyclobacterium sp. TaxID=1966343 RepID=UPI0019CA9315|nr:M56 family metallopeptidase [Cyclobacterium sp.]MBD3627454.1 M56 family metallopeptidase [Cyclobacterium sp.]